MADTAIVMQNGSSTCFLSLIELVDSFPYTEDVKHDYYDLRLPASGQAQGWIHKDIVQSMPWTPLFAIDHNRREVRVLPSGANGSLSAPVTAAFANLVTVAITRDVFKCIGGRHSEPFLIPGAPYPVRIERFATSLFGITTRGAHLTAYAYSPQGELTLWVPRRSQSVGTWKGMLDSTVAGGVAAGESPFENIVREAAEEASLSTELVRSRAVPAGVLTYMGISKGENGWEKHMALPDMVCVYDLELDASTIPRPCDDEVKEFKLMTVTEVKDSMLAWQWKPNSAVIMLDFFIRRGIITYENEPDFVEIVQRMHRRLPFPVSGSSGARS